MTRFRKFAISLAMVMATSLTAQTPLFDPPQHSAAKVDAVEFLYPEQITLEAGKPNAVTLHFRIAPGLHINSHAPKDEFLIPTVLSLPAGAGVTLDSATYPAGVDYTLPADPKMKLSVYTGEFAVQARLTAQPGDHLLQAKLRYQACDQTQCMPPHTISVPIDVIGR